MPRSVVFERCIGRALSRAALIEEHDAVSRWVKELPILRYQPTAGAPVQKHHWLAFRIAALFVMDFVDLRHFQTANVVGFDWMVESSQLCHAVRILSKQLCT